MDRVTEALFEAVETNNIESLVYLVRTEFACLHSLNDKGQSLLMIAAENGFQEMVSKLIRLGAPLRYTDTEGRDALFYAALGMVRYAGKDGAYRAIMEDLITAGIVEKRRDSNGFTAGDYAYLSQFIERV